MNTSDKKEIVRSKRYTPAEKSEVVSYVSEYNAANGRGGQSSAAAKFGISQLTIASWLKNAGVPSKLGKAGPEGSIQNKLAAMLRLGKEIEGLEEKINAKRAEFDSLKASL